MAYPIIRRKIPPPFIRKEGPNESGTIKFITFPPLYHHTMTKIVLQIVLLLMAIMALVLGCASRESPTELTGAAVGVDRVEEAQPVEETRTEASPQEPEEKTVIKTPEQTTEPVEKSTTRYACVDGSSVADPDECLDITAGKDHVVIFE